MVSQRSKTMSTPRWVKIFAWVGVVAVVVVLAMIVSGHGPWQHMQHMTAS
jgi:hypothetical protein